MGRWMIVLAIAGLFVALVAAPGGAKGESGPAKGNQQETVWSGTGGTAFGAVEVLTGEWAGDVTPYPYFGVLPSPCPGNPNLPVPPARGGYIAGVEGWCALMDPNYNTCDVEEATLTWTGKNTAELITHEVNCPLFPEGRVHTRTAHITPGGAVKLSGDTNPAFPPVDGKHWLAARSGCGLNGTFPVYHGDFNWKTGELHAETHFHGPCDGGTGWWKFGIGTEDGPLHATFTIDLTFDMGG